MVNRQNGSVRLIELPIDFVAMAAHDNLAVQGDRLAKRLADLRISQAELARRIGVKQPSIAALISGKSQRTRHLNAIAKVLETTPEYLTGETNEPSTGSQNQIKSSTFDYVDNDTVLIQEIDLAFGMGGGTFLDVPVKEAPRVFSRTLLRTLTNASPNNIYLASGIGDSMAPTIHNEDVILIDSSADTIRMSDQIWAFSYGDFGMIKRLRPMPGGGVLIMSDNPNVSDATAYDGEMHIIGKVVAIIRRMAS